MKIIGGKRDTNHALKVLWNHNGVHGTLTEWLADQRYREGRNHEAADSRPELRRVLQEKLAVAIHR